MDYRELRELMIDRVRSIPRPFELALSGGTDSTTVLFACLAAGIKPRCLTFRLSAVDSGDCRASRFIAKHFGLDLEVVEVPSAPEAMIRDIKAVAPHAHVLKKTIIQCLIPWLYIYPAMETETIVTGLGGDDLYCNQRKVQVALNTQGEEAIREWRKTYSDDLRFSNANIIRFGKQYGKECIDAYHWKPIVDWFAKHPAKSLNRPYEKHPSIEAFRDYYGQAPFRRAHSSYQVNSGLRDFHDGLLKSQHNTRRRKAVIALYRDILA